MAGDGGIRIVLKEYDLKCSSHRVVQASKLAKIEYSARAIPHSQEVFDLDVFRIGHLTSPHALVIQDGDNGK